MKGLSSNLYLAEISRATQAVSNGKVSSQQKRFLASLNLSHEDAIAIFAKMSSDGGNEVRPGVFFPNTEDWGKIDGKEIYDWENMAYIKDVTPEQIRHSEKEIELGKRLRAALARGITNTIVTPGVERPNMVDSSIAARLIFQFRSFGLSSTMKVVAAASQDARMGNLAPVLSGVSFSLALGAISYYTWAMSFGPGSKQAAEAQNILDGAIAGDEDALAKIADEAIARSGLLGVLEEVRRVGERIPQTKPFTTFAGTQTSRSPFERPATEALGPTAGLLEEIDRGLTNIGDKDMFEALQRLTPYQNVFYLRWGMDQLYEGAANVAGVN